MAFTFLIVVTVVGMLLVERGAGVVPCDAFLVEPREVVAGARGMAVLVDDNVLPLVVASIP